MAIYRKNMSEVPAKSCGDSKKTDKNADNDRLGRGLDSLTGDNTPAEKKPRVVRRGAYEGPKPYTKSPPPLTPTHGLGGKVVIRTEALPREPLHSARSARKGTTVLVRTVRSASPKRYKVNEPLSMYDRYRVKPGEPIVIDPRKKK